MKQMNVLFGDQINDNLYIKDCPDNFRDKYFNTFASYDKFEENSYIMSVGHNYVSEYMYSLLNKDTFKKKEYVNVLNNISTTKYILFFIIFERLPGNVNFSENNRTESLTDEEISAHISEIKKLALIYDKSNILVISSVFKYFDEDEKINNKLIQRIKSISKNVKVDFQYDINNINTSEVEFVCTNKVSYLFKKCVNQKIPIVLSSFVENEQSHIQKYFNNIGDEQFKIYKDTFELDSFIHHEKIDETAVISLYDQMNNQYQEIFKLINTHNEDSNIDKILLFNKSFVYKDLIDTEENKQYIDIGFDIKDSKTLVLTSLHDNFHRNVTENNSRWLGFDGDNFTNSKLKEKNLRFFYKSYKNQIDLYKFKTLSEIENKFQLDTIKDMDINEDGCILVFLDNYDGINYSNIEEWVSEWKKVFDGLLELNLSNVIRIRPYRNTNSDKFDAIFNKYFSEYTNQVYYDSSSRNKDILEMFDEEVYFCVKRQGPMFGKCFINGKLLISALSEDETKTKADFIITNQYEYNFHKLLKDKNNFGSQIQQIKKEYIDRKFEIAKLITTYLVSIMDIKNGFFFKTILNK
jgi:hypothetical protein